MPEEETKTKKRGLIRSFFRSFVDVKKWSSYDYVSSNVKMTIDLFCRFFSRDTKPMYHESYEESVTRLGMTEEQLANRKKVFLCSTLIYSVFAAAFFTYFVYLVAHGYLYAASFVFMLSMTLLLVAYREHFWYMQMQKRKLGCNFGDWVRFIFRREA